MAYLNYEMKSSKEFTLTVNPKCPDSRWIALDFKKELISEGKTPEEATSKAKVLTDKFILMFVPEAGVSYIF